jgi:hypothetical protein
MGFSRVIGSVRRPMSHGFVPHAARVTVMVNGIAWLRMLQL